jgi:sec-independent protein translocase protein TatC
MSFSTHMKELRHRILICLAVLIATTTFCLVFSSSLWQFLLMPLREGATVQLVNLSPTEGVAADFLVSAIFGILFASPVFFREFYSFCAPALHPREKSLIFIASIGSVLLFLAGAAFAFFVAIPLLLAFLSHYSDIASQFWSQEAYVSFLFRFELVFGGIFQMPMLTYFLTKSGFIDHRFLMRHFRIAIFLICFIAAIVTPPDLFSLFWVAVPMLLLYAASILVNALVTSREKA